MKKRDYTKEKLESFIIELAGLNGYENPVTYLDEMLKEVESFNDDGFTLDFYINIRYLCQKHASKFWNDNHKQQITNWLANAPILSFPCEDSEGNQLLEWNDYDRTWNNKETKPIESFASFLNHPKKEIFANELISEFKSSNGATIAYMLFALENYVIRNEETKLYEAMKKEFGFTFRLQTIFDKLRNIHSTELIKIEPIKARIKMILDKLQ